MTNIFTKFTGLASMIDSCASWLRDRLVKKGLRICPEASEADHFRRKKFSLDSLAKDSETHLLFLKVFNYVTKLHNIFFSQL